MCTYKNSLILHVHTYTHSKCTYTNYIFISITYTCNTCNTIPGSQDWAFSVQFFPYFLSHCGCSFSKPLWLLIF